MRTTEQILTAMHERGWRITAPRRAIVELVLTCDRPFSGDELYRALRKLQPGIGRATVFRTLDLLVDLGVIERVHHPSGVHRYVVSADTHRHHVVCVRCGAVAEFADCNVESVLQRIAAQTQYRILGHWLELTGLCAVCQNLARD